MANNDLSGTPTKAGIVSWLTELANAWRGALYPRNNDGSVFQLTANNADQAPDIGAQTSPFGVAYLTGLKIGGSTVDLAEFAEGTPVVGINGDEPAYEWVFAAPTAIAFLATGETGSAGAGRHATNGGDGGATSLTVIRTGDVYTTGTEAGGRRGTNGREAYSEHVPGDTDIRHNAVPAYPGFPQAGGEATIPGGIGVGIYEADGGYGGLRGKSFQIITGLQKGDTFRISVGRRGARGAGQYPGAAGRSDGFVVLMPVKP